MWTFYSIIMFPCVSLLLTESLHCFLSCFYSLGNIKSESDCEIILMLEIWKNPDLCCFKLLPLSHRLVELGSSQYDCGDLCMIYGNVKQIRLQHLTGSTDSNYWLFIFLTALQDGNIGLINAEIIESTGTEGGNITVGCSFTFSGKRRIFCKDECKDGDILIETEEDTAQRGRYSIEYKQISTLSTVLYVSITNLTQDGTDLVWTTYSHSHHHTRRLRSELQMVSFYWESCY